MPLQSENGDVRNNNNEHREKRGTPHLGGCFHNDRAHLLPVVRVVMLGELAKNVLHHNHRAIDDDAEIHRAERKQVGRNAAPA